MEVQDDGVLRNGGGHHRIEVGTSQFEKTVGGVIRKHIHEAAMDFYGLLGSGFDPYDMMQDLTGDFSVFPSYVPPYYRQNVKRGEYIPIYLDWNQLRWLRDRSRKLADNPYYQSAVSNRRNYAVGAKGIQIKSVKAREDCPDELVSRVQDVLDLWQDHNDMPEIEKTIIVQGDQDGDLGIRDFEHETGLLSHRIVYAEWIKPPSGNDYPPHYSFGIQTDPDDIETIQGYWVVENPIQSPMPAFVPANEMTHFKFNTPKAVKRGMPLFWGGTDVLLRAAFDLLRGVVTTANVRARYAVIRKLTKGVVREAAEKLVQELNQVSVTDPGTGQTVNVQRIPFGSIITQGSSHELEFPGASLDSAAFETALQMVLRALSSRCNMPEWMFTSDASNANYSSSLVAEAPSTKMFEELQEMICRRVAVRKSRGKESLAWRQINAAIRAGVLPPETIRLINLTAEGPSLVVRDKSSEADVHMKYLEKQIIAPQQVQQELGIDTKKTAMLWIEWNKVQAEQQAKSPQPQAPQAPPGQEPGSPQNGPDDQSQGPPGAGGQQGPPAQGPGQGGGQQRGEMPPVRRGSKVGTPLTEAEEGSGAGSHGEESPEALKARAGLIADIFAGLFGGGSKNQQQEQPTEGGGDEQEQGDGDAKQRAEVIADILGGLFGDKAVDMLDKL